MRYQTDPAPRPLRRILFAVSVSALVGVPSREAKPAPAPPVRDTPAVSQWERLLVADAELPFDGSGSMRAVLTIGGRSAGWQRAVRAKARGLKLDLADPKQAERVMKAVQEDLDGERLALIAWAKSTTARKTYEGDAFVRDAKLAARFITATFLNDDGSVRIKSIIESRCVRCHTASIGGSGASLSLETFDDIMKYTTPEKSRVKPKP